ncbi:HlyD family secretion protein [Isoalcanivorax beigongshangi]|uniref:HlyD family secretion protein n=1 Tax=Isoalcanivorax beigongshangi TaxID=3238810 RepID=A0ABV4AH05_9GAMM
MSARNFKVAAALLVIAAILVALWWSYRPGPVRLQGQVEAQQYLVSSKVPGRLGEVHVRRGDTVEAGAELFRIDSPELEAKLVQVDAIDRIAQSLVQALEGGTRDERVAATRSEWEKAQSARELAAKSWERVRALADEGLVSGQSRDETWTLYQVALRTEETAHEIHKLALAGARDEARDASHASQQATDSLREEVRNLLDDTRIKAHRGGVVSDVLLQPGELVPQGFPVVMLVDYRDAWALFNVREDLLSAFPEGRELTLQVPALKASVPFVVSHVSAMGDYATWRATAPGQDFDLRTFEVELRPREQVEGLRPGMSVVLDLAP